MFANYIKVAFRNIVRYKGHSAINIIGLALGLACCLLILLWVQQEWSYDRHHERVANIYRINAINAYFGDGFARTPAGLAPAAEEAFPQVIQTVRMFKSPTMVFNYDGRGMYVNKGILTEPSFFDIFSVRVLEGDPMTALLNPGNIVITEDLAIRLFGNGKRMGEVILIEGGIPVTVASVIENFPANSHIKGNYLGSIETLGEEWRQMESNWGMYMTLTYMLLESGTDIDGLTKSLNELGRSHNSPQMADGVELRFQPLTEVHLAGDRAEFDFIDMGSHTAVVSFLVIALFVLAIACINFVNLSTSRSLVRAREIGIRKTIGAGRMMLIKQYLSESFGVVIISVLLALLLVESFLPAFNQLAQKELSLKYTDWQLLAMIFGMVGFVGFLAGVYPAFVFSKFKPVTALKNNYSSLEGSRLRKVLVVFQFTLSIVLLAGTGIVYSQMNFVLDRDLGFNKENVLYFPIKGNIGQSYDAVKMKLQESSHISNVTAVRNLEAFNDYSTNGFVWEGGQPNFELQFNTSSVGYDYFDVLDFDFVAGRGFSEEFSTDTVQAVILNEKAVTEMKLEAPIGKKFGFREADQIIIGVVKDANMSSLYDPINPRVYFLMSDPSIATSEGLVLARTTGKNVRDAVEFLSIVWKEINPGIPFEYHFLDEAYETLYSDDMRIRTILTVFTVLSLFISALGILGLASFAACRRLKEIVIRKVVGASVGNIIYMLIGNYVLLVFISIVIASPITYYLSSFWLQNYAYQIEISWTVYLIPGLLVLILALIAVFYQSIKAALVNPVDVLRYE